MFETGGLGPLMTGEHNGRVRFGVTLPPYTLPTPYRERKRERERERERERKRESERARARERERERQRGGEREAWDP